MPRSTVANRRAFQYDKEMELRDYAAAAISATTSSPAIAFPGTKQAEYKAIVYAAAYTSYIAGTAQWTATIEFSADNVTFKQVGNSYIFKGTADQMEIALSGAGVEDIVPDAAYVRVTATKLGTPGNLTFGAFLAPCFC